MGPPRVDNLGDLARAGGLVAVRCRRCAREALLAPRDLFRRVEAYRTLASIPFRCARCGSRDVRIAAISDRDAAGHLRHVSRLTRSNE